MPENVNSISYKQVDANTRIYHLAAGDVTVVKNKKDGDFGSIFQKNNRFEVEDMENASVSFVASDKAPNGMGFDADFKDCEGVSIKGSKLFDCYNVINCKNASFDANGGGDYVSIIDTSFIKSDINTIKTKNFGEVEKSSTSIFGN